MGVHENESYAALDKKCLEPIAVFVIASTCSRLPGASRPIRTFRHPESHGPLAEQSLVLGVSDGQLKANAFIAAQQRKKTVGGRGCDQLESSLVLELLERTQDIPIQRIVELEKPGESLAPVAYDRN